ncbi:hypothetical protein BAE44_0013108 [Dichanthelium oligosanthes]|uniref:Uncharacterized protein n=1 Tax=Dichanthelium oligosanthes TaxID=888268 RepID=A0A1E5VL56_9POAL|nr:hypothetical protein BAE44_0013108 [Dichanthelium oligosanthes]
MAAVAISAMPPSCSPSLHGPSRLSRASSAAAMPPPLLAADGAQTTLFTGEGYRALMRGQCEPLSFSEDALQSRLLLSDENLLLQAKLFCRDDDAQLQALPFSLNNLDAPISEDDVDILASMFCEEEIWVLCAAHGQQQARAQPAGGWRSDDEQAGEKRKSPPWPSCIPDDDEDDDMEETESPPSPPPPPVKRARTKSRSRRQDQEHARAIQCQLREWHNDGDRAWMYSAQGHVPLIGGPGEVLVPTTAAGSCNAMVVQYARWRRSVRVPTRFFVERAVQQGLAVPEQQPEEDWMMPEYEY